MNVTTPTASALPPVEFRRTVSKFPCYDDARRYTGCIGQELCSQQRDHCWNGQPFVKTEEVKPIRFGGRPGRKPGHVRIAELAA